MSWSVVDSGGKVWVNGSALLGVLDATLSRQRETIETQPMEDASPTVKTKSKRWRLQLTRNVAEADAVWATIGAITDSGVTCIYYDANGTALFNGTMIDDSSEDQGRSHEFATQSYTLVSSGTPSVG